QRTPRTNPRTERMKLHEYQAKQLLAAAGAPVPRGVVASTAEEVGKAFDELGCPVVLKAQVHAGGRGKGGFKGSGYRPGGYSAAPKESKAIEPIMPAFADVKPGAKKLGGVKFVTSREDAVSSAKAMFLYPLVTIQVGTEGQKVAKILVVEAKEKIAREV